MMDDALRTAYARLLGDRGSVNRSDCPGPGALHRTITRRGTEPERLAAVNHAMSCPACLREFEVLRSLEHAVPTPRMIPRWAALAAVLVGVVGVGLGWQLHVGRPDPVSRGGGAIRTVAPAMGARVATPPRFLWHALAGATEYRVEILSDNGRPVGTGVTVDTSFVLATSLETSQSYIWQVKAAVGIRDSARSTPIRFAVSNR